MARRQTRRLHSGEILMGRCEPLKELRAGIALAARTDLSVLITGEVATARELVARLIHENSSRRAGPFVAVRFAAIPSRLASAELFGFAKGTFTRARSNRKGFLEKAAGGTVYLDEIEDAPTEIQHLLIRAMDTSMVRPVGTDVEISVDFRILAAARSEWPELARSAAIRRDFLHRFASTVLRVRHDSLDNAVDLFPSARGWSLSGRCY